MYNHPKPNSFKYERANKRCATYLYVTYKLHISYGGYLGVSPRPKLNTLYCHLPCTTPKNRITDSKSSIVSSVEETVINSAKAEFKFYSSLV